jgi:hypothetical protein
MQTSVNQLYARTEMICDTVARILAIWNMASVPHRNLASREAGLVPKCRGIQKELQNGAYLV